MASSPADEDYARALLSIFKAKQVRVRQSLPIREAKAVFLGRNMGRDFDFEAALRHATVRGWLAPALDMIRLTAPGADELHSVGFP